jgi:hypothetical protein
MLTPKFHDTYLDTETKIKLTRHEVSFLNLHLLSLRLLSLIFFKIWLKFVFKLFTTLSSFKSNDCRIFNAIYEAFKNIFKVDTRLIYEKMAL